MSKFHTLKVLNVNQETADAVSVSLEVPAALQNDFKFIQGQYLTFRFMVNGEEVRRSYSICSCAQLNEPLTVAVKRVANGKASNYINSQLKAGDNVEVMAPLGKFYTPLSATNEKHYYLFAGGSGITPMMAILKSVLQVEPSSKVTLFYGNNNAASIIFRNQLDTLTAKHGDRLKVVHALMEAGEVATAYIGVMSKDLVLKMIRENTALRFQNAEFFICGPGIMMDNTKQALVELDMPKEKIHIEYFTAKENNEDMKPEEVGSGDMPEITSGKAKVKIKYDGKEHEFMMDVRETVLEAALDAGYDPPYSCMVAACCTCRAKLLKGKVHMADRESLTDSEIKDGYVLTCQSHPRTAEVLLDYDI
jgi:ring-1,2-phenylacetyl-CoA epoxidase subunit PaaE